MGVRKFRLYDFDVVEAHNLSSQAYRLQDVGKPKVSALGNMMLLEINPSAIIFAHDRAFGENAKASDLVVVAVDSIAERKKIAAALAPSTFIVDGRMGGGQVEIWTASSPLEWLQTLEIEASDDPCAGRYISYTSYLIAGMIANTVKRHLMGENVPKMALLHTSTMQTLVN